MTSKEFCAKAQDIANNYKTLYVMGAFGAALYPKNKTRYTTNHKYNMKAARTKKIMAASDDTFGFDCVCLIKGILWGWSGKTSTAYNYGGAAYKSNGVPDYGANQMISVCSDVSTDFFDIVPGEVVWMKNHIGIYIGNGLAVECTPSWQDKVQITAVSNIGKKAGYNARKWTKHGKLPYVSYDDAVVPEVKISVLEWQLAAIADGYKFPKYGADGKWGAECESVAKKAVCKQGLTYTNKNLTRLVQEAVGVTVDGKYGSKTKAAVESYQRKHSLEDDGKVGIKTWGVIIDK